MRLLILCVLFAFGAFTYHLWSAPVKPGSKVPSRWEDSDCLPAAAVAVRATDCLGCVPIGSYLAAVVRSTTLPVVAFVLTSRAAADSTEVFQYLTRQRTPAAAVVPVSRLGLQTHFGRHNPPFLVLVGRDRRVAAVLDFRSHPLAIDSIVAAASRLGHGGICEWTPRLQHNVQRERGSS